LFLPRYVGVSAWQLGHSSRRLSSRLSFRLPFSEGLAAVKVGDKYGYSDAAGAVVIEAPYPTTKAFSEGLAFEGGVLSLGEWGFIDKTGTLVIGPFRPFS
jgi:hypothetical protein